MRKNLHCKSVQIVTPNPTAGKNLSPLEIIRDCHRQMNLKERLEQINLLGDYHVSLTYEEVENGVFLHLVKANEDSPTQIVPKPKANQKEAELQNMPAPKHGDYLQQECFAYFFGDYAIYLSNGINGDALARYVTGLAAKKSFIPKNDEIKFFNMANVDALKKIREHKIQSLSIGASLDKPTLLASKPQVGAIKRAISGIVFDEPSVDESVIGNYNYHLTINSGMKINPEMVDPLTTKGAAIFKELEADEASGVSLKIVLKNGEEMSLREITVSKEVEIKRLGNALDKERVRLEIVQYRRDLVLGRIVDEA